jgi:hypothetical protein
VAVRTSELTDENTADRVQQRIDKVWQVYGVGGVSELLLNMSMSDDERNLVLKQLGRRHEIDALIYVGTKKGYENAKKRKDDVRRIFSAIDDERRKELLNDIIIDEKEGVPYYATDTFNELMKVLKEASIEHNEIAHMLLGVKDKRLLISMIDWISILHGDEYMADILLSIDDNLLRSMISKLKDKPVLIARILGGADEVSKLRRLLNIIVLDGISNENMERVLGKLVINKNIVNELIDKLEDEQNEMLGRINTQPAVVDKIKCAISKEEEARLLQSICSESFRSFFDRCGYVLGNNTHKNLDSSDCAKLKEEEAYLQVLERMIKELIILESND